ncbi:MAG: CHAT domain-containing protein [Pseudonocardia sp.]
MTMPVELLSQVLALIEQPNWASVRGYVSAHPELLSPAADAALDVVVTAARQGNAPRMRRLLDGLEGVRRTLRRSRDVGMDTAFKEAAEAGAYEVAALLPAEFALMAMLFAFVGAETWTDSRRIVELHPELLEERTDAVLDQMVASIEADDGPTEAVTMLRNHQELLRQCRLVGVAAAFEDLTTPAERDPLLEAIASFLASPTPRLAQQQLAEHPEIVSARGVEVLEKLVERTGRVVPPDVAETMRARLMLLQRCLAVGVEAAFVEETGGRLHASELDDLLTDLLSTGGRDDVARLLRDHPDLLRDESGQAMAELRSAAMRDDDADTLAALDWLDEMRRVAETRTPRGSDASDPAEIALLPTVHAFISADTWPASRRVVDEHPELLNDVADRVLARLEREARDEGQPDFADMLGMHRRLLQRCREVGPQQAFAELGRGGDDPSAAEVERMLREALDELTENGAPEGALVEQLGRTGYFLFERHQATGSAEDIDAAVRCLEEVGRRVDSDDEFYAHHQHFRGKLLATRYARTHQPADIAAAAQAFRQAVDALPSGSPALPPTLTDLGHALLDLHKHTGEPGPLDDAVDAYRRAIAAGPDPTDLAGGLGNLTEALKARLDREHTEADEDEMIDALRRGMAAAEPSTPMWFDLSNNLGIALEERFEHRGDVADVDEAIGIFDTTLPLLRDDRAEAAIHHGGRGNAWRRRHRHDRARTSIDHAVDDYRAAAAAAPGLADRGTHRLSLANALIDRFHLLGELPDLGEAIDSYRAAAPQLPQRDDRHPGLLTSLANAYAERWAAAGEWPDLDAALRTQQEAVDRTLPGSEDWPGHLSNLGNRYRDRFDATGDDVDLEAAIRHHVDAVEATPADSDERHRHLNNLSISLRTRYERTGDPADLDLAVQTSRQAVLAAAADNPDLAGLLTTWASALIARYRRYARLPDLDTANEALRRAHDAVAGSPHAAIIAGNLANALRDRYDNTRDAEDLDEAIWLYERALAGRPNLRDRQQHRIGLANALSDRYERDHDRADLVLAVTMHRELLDQLRPGAPDRAGHCTNLGGNLIRLHDLEPDAAVLTEALALCEEAVRLTPETSASVPGVLVNLAQAQRRGVDGGRATATFREACVRGVETDPRTVLVAAQGWGGWAGERQAWSEASEAYRYGLDAVRRLIGAEASRADKEIWLRGTRRVATGLAAALSMSSRPRDAAVALERGRAMLLAEMLHERGAETAPGAFALDEPTFDDIARVAAERPLVYLAAAEHGGLALVVRDGDAEHVRLDDLSEAVLRERVAEHLRVYGLYVQDPTFYSVQWGKALSILTEWLWPAVVGPVLNALGSADEAVFVAGGLLGLLPLHAAWTPDAAAPTGRRHALDELTISYVPNARALHAARALAARTPVQRMLAVVEPAPVTAPPLPAAASEALGFAAGVPNVSVTTLEGTHALPLRFRREATDADVLHLICHGAADLGQPLDSYVLFAGDQRVRLRHLMMTPLQVRLAVLSACETNMAGIDLLDEALALPTGLLQAGVAGVVASQWIVPDQPTAMLMTDFAHRWAGGRVEPAVALRQAQRWLRDSTNADKISHWRQADLPAAVRDYYIAALAFEEPEDRAHADLTNWAAFTHVGA